MSAAVHTLGDMEYWVEKASLGQILILSEVVARELQKRFLRAEIGNLPSEGAEEASSDELRGSGFPGDEAPL